MRTCRKFITSTATKLILVILATVTAVEFIAFTHYFVTTLTESEEMRRQILMDRSDHPVDTSEKTPRIIHQIWQPHYMAEMPKNWRTGMESWIKHNPGWEHMMWNDEKINNLIIKHYPWFMEFYKTYRTRVQRFDAAGYLIMYHYGGIYVDMDITCPNDRVLQELIDDNYSATLFRKRFYSMGTDIFVGKRRSAFFRYVVLWLFKSRRFYLFPHWNIIMSTGPQFMYGMYAQYPFKSEILVHERIYANSRLIDHDTGSWHEWDAHIFSAFMHVLPWLSIASFLAILFKIRFCNLAPHVVHYWTRLNSYRLWLPQYDQYV